MAGRPVGPCFYYGQLGDLKLHCTKLPRQQYPLPAISSNSIMHVGNVNNNTLMGCSDTYKFVTATGTMCEGNNTKGDKPVTKFDIVFMSEGNMVNDNMTLGSADANLVTSLLTKGNNFNTITVDTMCMGCYKPQKVDSLCHFTP